MTGELLEETFGLEFFASYGFHEVQTVAVECPAHDGLHIFEDAFIVQVVDPETGSPAARRRARVRCASPSCTRPAALSSATTSWTWRTLYPPGRCACGSWLRRMSEFAGRGDNMVKLRGVNVWPEALGDLALSVEGTTNDYFVRAVRQANREELILAVVSDRPDVAVRRHRRRRRRKAAHPARREDPRRGGSARRPRWLDRGR